VKTDTQAERIELEEEAKQRAEEAKEEAKRAKDKAKEKAKRGGNLAKENADNPVVIGNAVGLAVIGTVLGVGAYRKYARDELTWKVVGAWAGVVGLFAVGDYYVSKYATSTSLLTSNWLNFLLATSSRSTPRRNRHLTRTTARSN
jgi:hypothetical protein